MKLYLRQVIVMLFVVFVAIAAAGCGQGDSNLSPQAKAFKHQTLLILDRFSRQIRPPLLADDKQAVEKVLEKLFKDAVRKKKPLTYGMAVMDAKGRLMAGRFANPEQGGEGIVAPMGHDYSHYTKIARVLKHGGTANSLLYGPDKTLYTVCRAIMEYRGVAGMVCIGWPKKALREEMGINEEEFLSLDFSS